MGNEEEEELPVMEQSIPSVETDLKSSSKSSKSKKSEKVKFEKSIKSKKSKKKKKSKKSKRNRSEAELSVVEEKDKKPNKEQADKQKDNKGLQRIDNKQGIRFSEHKEVIESQNQLSKKEKNIPKKSILKNKNLNKEEETKKLDSLPPPGEEEVKITRKRYSELLGMPKEDIFKLDSKEIYALLNFMGLDQFLSMYEFDQEMIDRLFDKLAGYNKAKKQKVENIVENEKKEKPNTNMAAPLKADKAVFKDDRKKEEAPIVIE